MSKTIDEKVVEMRFDNKDFEKNVSKSLKTIDELKFKLDTMDFRTNVKGLDEVGNAVKNLDMSPLENGIETVRAKFSALQIIGITALQNITNSAINAGKQIANSLTNSLIEGGKQRALKIKDAKFQMEGLLGTEEYAKQWDRIDESINYAVKDTAYGYDSAARAASQFLASNVKVGEEMDRSLRAISGVAAMTNSTYDDISNIFTRVSGQGRVMAIDLNSLAARGLNAAAILGKSMGKTESQIRDMVSKGKVSFNDFAKAMDDAFGAHAKKGNETFSGSLANMKAAMSRIGAKIWDPLLDNERDVFNQMRLLINDLNGNYLDGPIKVLNGKITEAFKSIVEFFEKGGVKNVLLGIGNTLQFLVSVIKPVKEVFREIFPKKSVDTLVSYTAKFKELTEKFKLSEEAANNIKSVFRGFFSVISTGIDIIKRFINATGRILSNLTGIPGGILGVLGAFGNWITKISESVKKSKLLNDILENTISIFEKMITKIKEVASNIDIFSGIRKVVSSVFYALKEVFGFIVSKMDNIKTIFKTANTGIFGLILLSINNITKSLDLFFRKVEKFNTVGNIGQILATVRSNLYEMTFNLKADRLMTIAKAVAILAAGVWLLSTIDPGSLVKALGGMVVLLQSLMKAFSSFMAIVTVDKDVKSNILKGSTALISLSMSLLILSGALKVLSSIKLADMAVALASVGLGIQIMIRALKSLSTTDSKKAAKALIPLAEALVIYAVAMKILSTIKFEQMLVGLVGLAGGLDLMVRTLQSLPTGKAISKAFSMVVLANALILLSVALKKLAAMSWSDIKHSLVVMGLSLLEMTLALNILKPEKAISKAFSLGILAGSLILLSVALKKLASMSWNSIGRSLAAMGGALLEISLFSHLMSGNLLSGLSLLVIASSLIILAKALKIFSSMDLKTIGKGLGFIFGTLLTLGVVGSILGALSPLLVLAAAAIALFGLATITLGKGLSFVAAGILAFNGAIAGSVDIIIASVSGIIIGLAKMVPELIRTFTDTIKALLDVIIETAPAIAHAIVAVIYDTLKEVYDYAPQILDVAIGLLIKVIDKLAERMPELMTSMMNLAGEFIKAFMDALGGLDPEVLAKGIEGIKGLAVIMVYLAALKVLAPAAAIGIIEFGLLVAELGIVLAAIGQLMKIPGLEDSINKAGDLLLLLGEAIGKFVAGLAKGVTSTLPEIGKTLTEFMSNVSGFVTGVKNVDDSVLSGTTILSKSILELTKSNFISSIADFITKGKMFGELGSNLSSFMKNAEDFIKGVNALKPGSLKNFEEFTKSIMAVSVSGFFNKITAWTNGKSALETLGKQLPDFGKSLKSFSDSIDGLKTDNMQKAVNIIYKLADITTLLSDFKAQDIKDKGWGFGSAIGHLAEGISYFSAKVNECGLDEGKITAACNSIKILSKTVTDLSDFKGERVKNTGWGFGSAIGHLAEGISYFSAKINECGFDEEKITAACNSIKELSNTISDLSDFKGKDIKDDGWGFGSAIGHLANGISYFSAKINECGFSESKVTSACNAIKELSSTISDLSDFKGSELKDTGWGFGSAIGHLAEGISYFSAKVNECSLDEGKITAACNAIKELSSVVSNLPDITGEDIENKGWGLGSTIGHLANGISYFASKVKEFNFDETKVKDISTFANSISEVVKNLPDIAGGDIENKGWGLGSTIGHLANAISYFSAKINESNLDEAKVTAACNSIKIISESIPNISNIKDGGALEDKGWGFGSFIGHLAEGIGYFSAKINGNNLDEAKVTAACNSIKILSETIPVISKIKAEDIKDKGWGFGSFIGHLAEGIGYFSAKINGNNLDESTINLACNAIKSLSEVIPVVSKIEGSDIKDKGWGFGSAIGHLGEGIGYFSAKINGNKLDEATITVACNAIKSLSDIMSALPDTDGGTLENKGWGFGSAIGHLANGISYFSAKVNESGFNDGLITSACNAVKSLSDTISSLPDMDGGTLENKGWGFGSAIGHLGNGISAFINGIGGADITNMEAYIGYVQQFANIASGLTEDAGTKLTNFAGGISVFATNFVSFFNSLTEIGLDTIEEGIGKVNELIAMASSIAEINVEQISTFSNSLVQVANDGVTGFCNAFEGSVPKERAKQAVVKMLISALAGAIAMKPRIITEFNTIAEGSIAALRSYYQSFFDAGKYLSQGFADGITANSGAAIAVAAEMGRRAAEALRNATDEHSPSKITEEIGNYFGEGLVIGIRDYFGKVYNTAFNVGDMAKEGLSNAIAKISQMVEDGIDTSPTIRPVLDLSEVEQGASYLNSMLGTNSVGLRENINSISNGFNSRIQNGSGLDLLNAINKLEATVRGSNGNTLNIYTQELDSEKLDQIVRHVNKELGVIF